MCYERFKFKNSLGVVNGKWSVGIRRRHLDWLAVLAVDGLEMRKLFVARTPDPEPTSRLNSRTHKIIFAQSHNIGVFYIQILLR